MMVVPPSVQPSPSQPAIAKKQRHPNGYILETWLQTHKRNLYPSREEKVQLGEEAQMSYNQVARWFANRRRKLKLRTSNSPAGSSESSSGGEKEETLPATPPSALSPPSDWLPQDEQQAMLTKAVATEGEFYRLDSNNNTAETGVGKGGCIPQQFHQPQPTPHQLTSTTAHLPPPFAQLGLGILDPSLLPPYWWSILGAMQSRPIEDQQRLPPISFLHHPIHFANQKPTTQDFRGGFPQISQYQQQQFGNFDPVSIRTDFEEPSFTSEQPKNYSEARILEKLSSMEERESIAISVLASFSQQVTA